MRISKKAAGLLMMSMLLAASLAVPAFGATRKKIATVNITVESNIQPGARFGEEEIEVETRGGNYSFDYYEIENVGFEWTREDVPQIAMYFRAEDGYYFSLTKATAVKLTGATYVKASKQESSEILKLVVKLPPLAEHVSDLGTVTLTDTGFAVWDPVEGAGSYEVRLYKNGNGVGVSMLSTTDNYYNFQNVMTKPASYQVKVRPVNALNADKKGEWVESDPINLTSEQAAAIRSGDVPDRPEIGEWKSDEKGYWYMQPDGSYATNMWLEYGGKWYFFGEDGYMKTGWVQGNDKWYYLSDSGEMLVNTTTPDGYQVTFDGSLKSD